MTPRSSAGGPVVEPARSLSSRPMAQRGTGPRARILAHQLWESRGRTIVLAGEIQEAISGWADSSLRPWPVAGRVEVALAAGRL